MTLLYKIHQRIHQIPSKTMPLWLSVLIVYNASLLSGQFDSENCSKPFLKKSINPDAFVLSNYQLISDLVLSSKVTERFVCCYGCEFWPVCFFQEAAPVVSPSPQPEPRRGFPSAGHHPLLDTVPPAKSLEPSARHQQFFDPWRRTRTDWCFFVAPERFLSVSPH